MQEENSNQIFGMDFEAFIDADILELLGVKNISPEEKEKIFAKMLDTIQNRVIIKIDDRFDEAQRNEFKRLLGEGDNDKINQFFENNNIDIKQLLMLEAINYKTELVALAKNTQNQ